VEKLLESTLPAQLVTVAGRNESLEEELQDLADGARMKLIQLGKIDFVDDLIAASDVVITKAGGLIVSEVLARGTPIVIIDPIPGQEEWNADFVAGAGAGIQLRMPEMVPYAVASLLRNPERMTVMAEGARQVGRPSAAVAVVERTLLEYAALAQVA
jgi:processive 1,2-diacylglycerol beta-glucosyltransferase